MKKFLTLALVGAVALGVTSAVYANVCAFDPVPAATLLFPFVHYQYGGGLSGTTTVFSITNVSSEAQIVHVTVWTDFSIAILDFNILLTGYDMVEINIRDILADGQLPITLNNNVAGNTPADDGPVSSRNELNSDWLAGLLDDPQATSALGTRCATTDPAYPGQYTQKIPGGILALFEGWLKSSQTQDWYHSDDCIPPYGGTYQVSPDPWMYVRGEDSPTWMYITADVTQTCNKNFPDEAGYWLPGDQGGEARYDNVLTGRIFWVDNDNNFSEAGHPVHLEADVNLDNVATSGDLEWPISFYARYANYNDLTSDWREPLGTAWAFEYIGATSASFNTKVRAFKASTNYATIMDLEFDPYNESPDEFVATNCNAYTYYAWDMDENVNTTSQNPWSQPGGEAVIPNLLPLETQEVDVSQFNLVDDRGWCLFVWPASNYLVQGGPATTPDYYQTHMGTKYEAYGYYSAYMDATLMANYNCFSDQVIPMLGINYTYVNPTGGYNVSPGAVPMP